MSNKSPHKEFLYKSFIENVYNWLSYNFIILKMKVKCHIHGHKYILLYNKNYYGVILKDDIYQCSVCYKRITGKECLMFERRKKIKNIFGKI
jgi:hypothetical protein